MKTSNDRIIIKFSQKYAILEIETVSSEDDNVEIWNSGQKIYSNLGSGFINLNLIDYNKDVIIKGNIILLNCYNCGITALNIDNSNLEFMNCSDNPLSLQSVISILKSLGKRKAPSITPGRGTFVLGVKNLYPNITQSSEFIKALNMAEANGWVIDII